MGAGLEVWTFLNPIPRGFREQAVKAEAAGWDGLVVGEAPTMTGDPYVQLTLAAVATSRILLGTGVTNSVTRHPAVTAAAIASIQAESAGRAVLGIGTGGSAVIGLGLEPARLGSFRDYIVRLQGYLGGEAVGFTAEAGAVGASASTGSALRWLDSALPKVPVEIGATGPKIIAAGALLADRLALLVGADPERIRWGIDVARSARKDAGLDPGSLPLTAYVPIFVHPDRAVARRMISGGAASIAFTGVLRGDVAGPMADAQRDELRAIRDAYDIRDHFTVAADHAQGLSNDLIDTYAVAGPTSYCVERLLELAEAGISKVVLIGPSYGIDKDEARAARARMVDEVLPALR
jgi:5,10-methylenetetrahydromethanopterin reductase